MKVTAVARVTGLGVVALAALLAHWRHKETSGFDRQMDHIAKQLEGTPPCEVYFFESWSGHSHPVRPVNPQSYEEAIRKPGYYRAWLCQAGAESRFVMFEGIGALTVVEITNADGVVKELRSRTVGRTRLVTSLVEYPWGELSLVPMFGSGVGTKGAGGPGILHMFGNVAAAMPPLPCVTGDFGALTPTLGIAC